MQLYNWLGYANTPDLLPWSYHDVFGCGDGVFNRALPVEGNYVPGVALDHNKSLEAAGVIAEASLGHRTIPQEIWNRNPIIASRQRPIVLDLEQRDFLDKIDITARSKDRAEAIGKLCECVEVMKAAGAKVGSYFPYGPSNKYLHPSDPRYEGLRWMSEQDMRPFVELLDFFCIECSMMQTDVDACYAQAKATIDSFGKYNKPFIAEMQLCYAHEMPDSNPKKWTLVPTRDFFEYIYQIREHPDVSGICVYGQYLAKLPYVGDPKNGTNRTEYKYVRKHVEGLGNL